MPIFQAGDPNCPHTEATKEEKGAFGLVPVYMSNCLKCGEFMFRFPSEAEVPKKEMENAFDQTENLLKGNPTD